MYAGDGDDVNFLCTYECNVKWHNLKSKPKVNFPFCRRCIQVSSIFPSIEKDEKQQQQCNIKVQLLIAKYALN